jgi:solute carrier family 25 (mitochondrial uncoupling protein), member 8/9
MQAQGSLPVDQRPFTGTLDCYQKTIAEGGIKRLWLGVGPNVLRNSIINAAELASYDQYKEILVNTFGFADAAPVQLFCAAACGITAVICGSPVDVLKTRMMNIKEGESASIPGMVMNMLKKEGPTAFYKGFTANCMRLGSWTTVMFGTFEQIKNYFD